MRKPVKPGSYRILDRGGTVVLTGRKLNGTRVRIPDLGSYAEAEKIAATLFPQGIGAIPVAMPEAFRTPTPLPELDEFGLPPINPAVTATLNMGMGMPPPPPVGPPPPVVDAEKKARQAKNAKSLMELAGVGWAAGSVWVGRAACERMGKEPPGVNPKQVNDLADVTRDTFAEWFGDRDVKPWQMMMLLTLGIPISMLLQARPKKKLSPAEDSQNRQDHLRSVT